MQEVLQSVTVSIPHSMEVLQSEPLRFEYLLGAWQSEAVKKSGFELIVGHAVLLSAADVVFLIPELFANPVFAHLSKKSSGVFYGSPFENSAHGHMEGGRINHLKDARIKNAALTQGHPPLETCLLENFLRTDLRECVHIIFCRGLRLVYIAPVTRRVAVSILCHRANIYNPHIISIRLRKYCLHDILRRCDIGLQGLFRIIVSCRGYHSSHMENIVRAVNAFKHILITRKVAPDYSHSRI